MAFSCKNKCGLQEVEWQFLDNAWLPVISVCNQNINVGICPVTTCTTFTPPTYLWDACFTDNITKTDNDVTSWFDINSNFELIPVDAGKEPGFIVSTNGGTEFNMITFNGTNQVLGCPDCFNGTTEFTVAVVVNNLAVNLSENVGAIFSLLTFPFTDQILLGYEDGNIVLKYNNESLTDLIEPVAVDDGFHIITVRYTGVEGTENVDLTIDGNSYTNSSSFVFNNTVDTFNIGSSLTDYALNGEIGWFAFYDSAISNGALNNVMSFAANKFNITLG